MDYDEDLKNIIIEWQKKTYRLRKCAFIISAILIFIFFATVAAVVIVQFSSNNDDWKLSAEICNTFTGIVLGFVAMAVSVISIALSFYNTIQAEKSNLDSVKQFSQITVVNEKLGSTLNGVSMSLSQDMDKLTELIEKQSNFEELLSTIEAEIRQLKTNNFDTLVSTTESVPQNIDDGEIS